MVNSRKQYAQCGCIRMVVTMEAPAQGNTWKAYYWLAVDKSHNHNIDKVTVVKRG